MLITKLLTGVLKAIKVDYVVEEGNDGSSHWRKWASGISEFWYAADETFTINTARGNWYSSNVVTSTFPSGLFDAKPTMVFGQSLGTTAYVMFAQCTGLSHTTYMYRLVANGSNGSVAQHHVSAYAIGRWK